MGNNGHIKITFPDGNSKEFNKGVTSYDIAKSISSGLAEDVLVSEVNGKLVDLVKPIEDDAQVKFHKFDDEDGKKVYISVVFGGYDIYNPGMKKRGEKA